MLLAEVPPEPNGGRLLLLVFSPRSNVFGHKGEQRADVEACGPGTMVSIVLDFEGVGELSSSKQPLSPPTESLKSPA